MKVKKYKINKAFAGAAQGIALALTFALQKASYCNNWYFKDLQNRITDNKIKRLIVLVFSKVDMLLVDIADLKFLAGELVEIDPPELPTEFDMQEIFKSLSGTIGWSASRVKDIYESFSALHSLLVTFAEVLKAEEGQEPDPTTESFRAYILDSAYVIGLFGKALPYLFEAMFQMDIMSRPSQEEMEKIGVPTLAQAIQQTTVDAVIDSRAQAFASEKAAPEKKFKALEKAGLLRNNELLINVEITKAVDSRKGLFMAVVQKPAASEKEADLQEQWATAEVIQESMEEYMEKYQILGLQHRQFQKSQGVKNPDFRLIQNFIVRNEDGDGITINGKFLKNGTWVQQWLVINPKLKKMVFDGKLTGLSIGGIGWVKEPKKTTAAA